MHRSDEQLDRIVDETLDSIRDSRPDPDLERAAIERAWTRISAEADANAPIEQREIRSCTDFRSLIDPYLRGELSPARALLVKDHFNECVPCRRALKQRRAQLQRPVVSQAPAAHRGWGTRWGWRAAAAAVIFVGVYGLSFKTDLLSFESGGIVRVEHIEGELFKITNDGAVPLAQGETVEFGRGEGVRTAKGSTAVLRLADDSQVELRERSELAVFERNYLVPGRKDDGVIDLERGSIIVEASDQGSGHLYVDTDDCQVAVTGTVFSVNHGIRGSRVSVVEGEVHVSYGRKRDVLEPGQQATTNSSLQPVPVEDEIAWSRKHEQYVALLREVRALSKEIDRVLRPELRYSTDLLDLAPADTTIYVAMPNVSNGLGQAWDILQSRVATSPVLQQWWDEQFVAGHTEELGRVFDKIRAYGDNLGDEIVLTVAANSEQGDEPLFLAHVTDAAAFTGLLREDLTMLSEQDPDASAAVIEGPLPAAAPEGADHLFFWIDGDLLAVSPEFRNLHTLDAIRKKQYVSLDGGTFHAQLAERYRAGVEWLVGVDLERILGDERNDPALVGTGFADMQHLIAERRQQGERTESRADLTFAQPRQRMAAWLAEPAPLGSLDYITPDANFVAAFAMKDLGTLVDELFGMLGGTDEGFAEELARFEAEHRIDVRQDIAAPLGGEFALALDGPVLPKPSWKLVVEVYDPARLQQSIEWFAKEVNREVADHGAQGFEVERSEANGRSYMRIVSLDTGLEANLVFDDGYVIAAPSRALLDRALQTRASGVHIAASHAFRELLPSDDQMNFSGVVYHNLGPVIGPLSGALGTLSQMAPEQQALLSAVSQDTAPALALIYGQKTRISVVASTEGGLLGAGMNSLTGFGSLLGMQQSLMRGLAEGSDDGVATEVR